MAKLSDNERAELACVYAGLLLHDDNLEITSNKIQSILDAAGVKVEAYYPEFFAKFMKDADLNSFMNNIGGGAAAPSEGAPAEAPKEEKKGGNDDKKGGKDDKKGGKDDKKGGKDDKKGGKDDKKPKKEEKPEPDPEPEEDEEALGGLFDF